MNARKIPVADTDQVLVHNVHRCEQSLAAVFLLGVEAEDLLHGIGAVNLRYKPTKILGLFLLFETVKIVELLIALFIVPQAQVAGLRVFRDIR